MEKYTLGITTIPKSDKYEYIYKFYYLSLFITIWKKEISMTRIDDAILSCGASCGTNIKIKSISRCIYILNIRIVAC